MNIYGPIWKYWNNIFSSEWLKKGLVVVVRDLNFTLRASKVLAPIIQDDSLSSYFINKLEKVGLLDIKPTKLTPTWINKRIGYACIAKILDHFTLSKSFLKETIRICQWVFIGEDSYHCLVLLEVDPTQGKLASTFNMNS